MRDAEYDAFGPWIIDIDEKHPLPKAFLGYLSKENDPIILFKVPRDMDRRDARPGMDLYNYVVAAYDNELWLLKREISDVKVIKVAYRAIGGLINYQNLLIGELTLCLEEENIKIRYNTVSTKIITRLITFIRSKYIIKNQLVADDPLEDLVLSKMPMFYRNKFNELKKHDVYLSIIALQPLSKIEYKDKRFIKRTYYKLRANTLPSSLYLSNKKELIIIKRGIKPKKFRDVDYSYTYIYIPYNRMTRIIRKDEDLTNEIHKLAIKTNHYTLDCLFKSDNQYKHNLNRHLQFVENTCY